MLPGEILKLNFLKCTFGAFSETNSQKNESKLTVKMACVEQQINNYRILSA